MNTNERCGLDKEILDDLRHQPALLGFGRLADDRRKIQLAFGESLKRRGCDSSESIGVHLLDYTVLDDLFGKVMGVHLSQHSFKLVGWKDIAEHVEYLAGSLWIKIVFDAFQALEQLVQNATLSRVGRDEVEDEAILFLTVAMDAAHALFEPDRVPRDVVVDHEPAELKIDAFTRGLSGNKYLALFLELALSVDARARGVSVSDLHLAVNLRNAQAPLAQLAERPAIFAVADKVVERIFVLREDQKLHLGIGEDSVLGDD